MDAQSSNGTVFEFCVNICLGMLGGVESHTVVLDDKRPTSVISFFMMSRREGVVPAS